MLDHIYDKYADGNWCPDCGLPRGVCTCGALPSGWDEETEVELSDWEPEFVGIQLECGMIAHVSKDIKHETLEAINKLVEAVLKACENGEI